METVIHIVDFIVNHWIATFWISIFFVFVIYVTASKMADQLNSAYKKKMEAEEHRLSKLAEDLSDRENSLSAGERLLQEKELQFHNQVSREVESEVSFRLSDIDQQYADIRQQKGSLLKQECELARRFSKSYVEKMQPVLSQISSLLPACYAPLLHSPCPENLRKKVYSAVNGELSILDSFDCKARVLGSGGKIYQVSLTKCTCEDFIYRGGPCKHMLHLLFSIASAPLETLQRSVRMDVEIQNGYIEQIRTEKNARTKLEKEYKGLQEKSQEKVDSLQKEILTLQNVVNQHEANLRQFLSSNLTAIPWLAGMMADYLTYDLEVEAKKLEWGSNVQRQKKVASIRDIRSDAMKRIQAAKEAVYQLEYLRSLYPALDDVLDTSFDELDFSGSIPDYDPTRDYISKDEWTKLSPVEKDQLALDRYVQSRNKSNWQIGRDYELSVAYEYMQKGYFVDTFGNYMGLEDLGRDLIARNAQHTLIIQCKYWSKAKTIHEKHIFQLYGTLVTYRIKHQNFLNHPVCGIFVTNTVLSSVAHEAADMLGISIVENHEMVEFPRIKCNIGHDEFGETRIYHLPMDAQYDVTQIKSPGECYAFTVQEAVDAGFRRAYKWSGRN